MSNRNNDVFQVLVTSGDSAILAAGNTVEDLAIGQIGVFDANTNLSVTAAAPREFYFAVGLDRNGVGSLQDIKQSAGQFIQRKGIRNYSFKPHTAGQPMVVTVAGYKAQCDTDYAVKVEFRNSRIYRLQGFNQFSKTYAVRTGCCDGCAEGCGSADPNELTLLMVAEIMKDVNGLLLAQSIVRQDVTSLAHGTSVDIYAGDPISDADIAALIAFNALSTTAEEDKVYTDFTITSVPLKLQAYCGVNLGFHKFVETVLITSLVDGFGCSGTATVTQEVVYQEGSGKNIQQKEYHASAWGGSGPYVLSEITGTAQAIPYDASANVTYDQFILEYNQTSESGWLEYENVLSTIIAVPEVNTVTRASLATVMDILTNSGGFEALADDAAAANVNPVKIEVVVTDETKDGIA